MRSDTPLDYAVFQLSPERSRCELFVSGNGSTEKLASGLLKPFVTHLTVAEEQVAQGVQSIKLEVEKCNEGTWFTKGTLERFVRFVSTPEVLELVHTFDAEMSQLESARRIYLQGSENQLSSDSLGADARGASAAADVTKKELLRAIDVRLAAVRQDLTMACARASAAGFTADTVSGLQLFSDQFGAHRLNEACTKFISVNQRRPDLISPWKARVDDRAVRSSSESDMSIDDPSEENALVKNNGPHKSLPQRQHPHRHHQQSQSQINQEQDATQCLEESDPSTCQQLKTSATFPTQRSLRESSSDRDEGRESEGTVEKEETTPEAPQTSQLSRRLSVQDRINMFENKQKEQTRGSGGKVMVGKSVELRRLSSDVSSAGQLAEKAVLRRWSGVSDMSLDLSYERKETESSESTPGSTSNRQSQSFPSVSEDTEIGGSLGKAKSYQSELRDLPVVEDSGVKDGVVPHNQVEGLPPSREVVGSKECSSKAAELSDQLASQPQIKTCSTRTKDVDWKDHMPSETKSFSGIASDVDLKDHLSSQTGFGSCVTERIELKKGSASQTLVRASSTGADHTCLKDQVASQAQFRAFLDHAEDVALNDRTVSQAHSKAFINRADDLLLGDESQEVPKKSFPSRVNDGRTRDQLASQAPTRASPSSAMNVVSDSKEKLVSELQSRPFSGKSKGGLGAKNQSASQAQYKGFVGELSAPQIPRGLEGKIEESEKMEFGGFPVREEDYGLQGIKLQRQSSAPEQNSKFRGRRSGSTPTYGNGEPIFSQRKVIDSTEMDDSISTEVSDQVQKVRLTKGNQELNDELQVKANELEKLFAAHKLRAPADQSTTTRRSKPAEMQMEQVSSTIYRTSGEVTPEQFPARTTMREPFDSSNAIMRTPDNQEYSNALKQNIPDLMSPENSRGKFYDSYMQKRNAKLREEWSLKRDQKEAKMKAMQDSFERSRVEMEAKFAGSSDRKDSSLYARQRAEKLRSFNMRLIMKNQEQHPIDILRLDGDDDPLEFSEQNQYEQAGSFSERLLVDGSSRFSQSKKTLPNRTPSSSTSRTSAAPAPRSSTKSSNSSSGRRRVQAENPLAQSVPNFSDFRKENTKPSSGISKTTTRTQFRNYARSKSITEESPVIKEDKSQRSQSMRKSFVVPGDLKDLSPLNSDAAILAQLKFAKEQVEPSLYGKMSRNGESKPFLKKGNGIGPGAGAGVAKLKASMASEILKTDEESDDMTDQLEDSVDLVKEEEEECEREMVDEALQAVDYATDSDNENPVTRESENYGDPALESSNVLGSFCQVDPDSVAEVTAAVPSKFYSSMGPQQDSPGESPVSWNSHALHPFSYTHETSDVDASIDSPIGSPASWNSHSLTEADAARMRKKWGSAQKPVLVANSSHHQSRMDVTRGFKRLLKFGRKSRGTESLVDWISATTSEGDDDAEDGRDLASRSSEDLRKSRMGLSQDALNDGELFNEQVQALRSSIPTAPSNFKLREDHLSGSSLKAPRSFFSLSTFRSKGSESKPR